MPTKLPQSLNDPFSSAPKESKRAAPVTQGGPFVSTYIADKITCYLARPSS